MTGTALVGPLRRHYFGDRSDVVFAASLPRNTLDIRSRACAAHRFACDCREALLAENTAELRAELHTWTRALRTVLAGHRAFDWGASADSPQDLYGDGPLACKCHGCQVVRAARASVYSLGGDYNTGIIQPPDGTS